MKLNIFVAVLLMCGASMVVGQKGGEPLVRVPIQVGNENVQIELFDGDNIRTVATNFLSKRGMSMDNLETLVRLISEQISRDSSVVVETPDQAGESQEEVSVDVTITVPLTFKIGEPLEAAALRFCEKHGLDANRFQQILVDNIAKRASVLSEIQRNERVIAATLTVDTNDGELLIQHFEGDDPLQTVVRFCVDNGLDVNTYQPPLTNALAQLLAKSPK